MWSTDSIYLVFLAAGFTVGFGHCVGMCGPIVVSFCLGLGDRRRMVPNILYNAGRITTYAILGGILGASGSFTGLIPSMAIFQKAVMMFAGLVIALMGLAMTGWVFLPRFFDVGWAPFQRFFSSFERRSQASGPLGFYTIGLVLGLLPCGPVYTALLSAARMGMENVNALRGAAAGALLMLCFGLGTIPALLLIAGLSDLKWLKHRQIIYKIGGVMIVGVGIYFLVKGVLY